MQQRSRSRWLTIVSMGLAAVALGGCPKTPSSGVGAGATAGVPATTGLGVGGAIGTGIGAGGAGIGTVAFPDGGTTLPALPSPRDFRETSALGDIHFEFDRYVIRAEDRPVLDANARWLQANTRALVLIEGHADERGTNEYNLALAERRAKATRDQLVERGIAVSRITIVAYGEERPACSPRTEACWAQNRRAHFLVQ
jgi:peptidoglycan-associated lipoprotein